MTNETKTFDAFKITCHKGFALQFSNGWGVSVQFGPGNYTDCQGGRFGDFRAPQQEQIWAANTAEVAVFVPKARQTEEVCGSFLHRIQPHDDVAGWVEADVVAALLAIVSSFKAETPDEEARAAVRAVLGCEEDEDWD